MASHAIASRRTVFSSRFGTVLTYSMMVLGMVVIYLAIRSYGETLAAPAPIEHALKAPAGRAEAGTMLHVLLALVVIIVLARLLGAAFRLIHQPPVIGEIIAGILLGPSFLGRFAPSAAGYLIPISIAPFLNVISQVGVVLYMFLVGLDLDPGLLKRRGHSAVAISHASIIVPFLMGAALALLLYPRVSSSDIRFTSFSLFLGVSMSVTAFPVLARILTDRGMHKTRMGAIALTCAAVDDVTAWCLLALVVSIIQAHAAGGVMTLVMAIAFVAAMFMIVRPLMVRLSIAYGNRGRLTQGLMAFVFVLLLLSAWATDMIGIHAVFGAFALGAMTPHDSGLARELTDRLEDLLVVLLLPAFFAFTGLRTQIGLLGGAEQWMLAILIILVASIGKFGGSAVAARLTGLSWRDASALGILMNTRGLVELIVLNIGFDFGIISPALFAMLVLMALVTTVATTPILHLIGSRELTDDSRTGAEPSRAAPRHSTDKRPVLAAISDPRALESLLNVALAAHQPEAPVPRVLSMMRRPAGGVRSGLREVEARVPPRVPILLSAIDHARRLGANVEPIAMWTDDPALDIVATAREIDAGWILIGFHQPVFGADAMGGIVRSVLRHASSLPIHVGVVTRGQPRRFERIFAVLDNSGDGRAALDLATRIARRTSCSLHLVLAGEKDGGPEPELAELVKDASRIAGKWLYTDVLRDRSPMQLADQTRGQLVVLGARFANDLVLPLNVIPDEERCVIVVQGGEFGASTDQNPA